MNSMRRQLLCLRTCCTLYEGLTESKLPLPIAESVSASALWTTLVGVLELDEEKIL